MCTGSQAGGALLPGGGAGWTGASRKDADHYYPLPSYQLEQSKAHSGKCCKSGAQLLQPGALYIAGPKSSR